MRRSEQLRYLILAAQREGNRLLGQGLKPLGVTPSQAEVLRLLQQRQPLTLNGLGELLVCETGTSPSRLVDRLAAVGLVDRRVADGDRRHVQLSLTAEGARVARAVADVEESLYGMIDAVGDDTTAAATIEFLRGFVDELPAGQALARRIATE